MFVCVCVKNDRIYTKVPPVKSLNTTQYAIPDATTSPAPPLRDELGRPRNEVRAFILKVHPGGDKLAGFGASGALRPRT